MAVPSAGRRRVLACAATLLALRVGVMASAPVPFDVSEAMARAGERVQAFFERAHTLVCLETVSLQPLGSGLTPDGFGRTVESDLRISWEPGLGGSGTEAHTRRQVLKVNGRPPRANDHRACTTPEQQESETQPLSMLLPAQRERFRFTASGLARVDRRDTLVIDFQEVARASADVSAVDGLDDCIRYDVVGGQRGRLWIDRDTHDVLRLDQRLATLVELRLPPILTRRPGAVPMMTLERDDTSWRFRRVAFENPEESLVLPASSTSLRILRGSGNSRLRTVTTYSAYQRFLTAGRVVG